MTTSKVRWLEIAALCFILGFSVFVRLRLLSMPLERDEGEYAYAGQLMLQGIPPYKLAYNMKLPGTYGAYALIMALFGQTIAGIHIGLILINSLTSVLVYFLGRQLFGAICGLAAAAAFSLLTLSPAVMGLAAHATHFVTLFAVAGMLVLLRFRNRKTCAPVFWSGLLFGLAFLMKQQGVFFGVFGGLILAWHELQRRPLQWRPLFARLSAFAAGAILPFAGACVALMATGVFHRFWFWTFSYARRYAAITPLTRGWIYLREESAHLWSAAPGLWIIAALGGLLVLRRAEARRKSIFLVGFLVTSFATACPGLYFREHYFIPLLPVVAIFVGAFTAIFVEEITRRNWGRAWVVAPLIIFAIAMGQAVFRERSLFFRLSPIAATRTIYGQNPFPEAVEIARYIREHTTPESQIAVLGSEPEIYFYSQRHSATGYIYTYPLVELQEYAPTMQQEMIAEIEAAKPSFVVKVEVLTSWMARPGSSTLLFDWFKKYGPANLRSVGLIDVYADRPAVYRWEEKAVAVTPRSENDVRVFERRTDF